MISPGAKRGTLAAILGFENLGLMVPQGLPPGVFATPKIAYIGLADDIRYRDGNELRDRYAAAVESDSSAIDMSVPRLFWADEPGEVDALKEAYKTAAKKVMGRTPIYGPTVITDGIDSGIEYMTLPL
jgi:hypothetical protein